MERESIKASTRGSAASDQRRRRKELLALQKERRAALAAHSRGLDGPMQQPSPRATSAVHMESNMEPAASADHAERAAASADAMEASSSRAPSDASAEPMETERRRRTPRAKLDLAAALMTPEWLVDLPEDLSTSWYVVARPSGKRCLVSTGGGTTTATRRGGRSWRFPSALPGGSRQLRAARCELDCIWNEYSQTYYVLDVLTWKDQRYVDCSAEFRLYWAHAKLAESTAHEASSTNPCRFVVPAWLQCTPAHFEHAYGAPSGYEKDGLLFVHKEACYEAGPTPLLLSWSDAKCSSRFYDYGSEQMAAAVEFSPDKAERWRTDQVESALSYEAIAQAVLGAMEVATDQGGDSTQR